MLPTSGLDTQEIELEVKDLIMIIAYCAGNNSDVSPNCYALASP
jgi:hypothetical protein